MTTHPPPRPPIARPLSLPPPEFRKTKSIAAGSSQPGWPVLFVRLLDENLQLLAAFYPSRLRVPSRQSLCTDSEGVLFCDGCDPGVYTLSCQRKDGRHGVQVHTITLTDLEEDHSPYIAII